MLLVGVALPKKGNYFLGQYTPKMPPSFCQFGGGFHDILPHLQLSLHGNRFQQTFAFRFLPVLAPGDCLQQSAFVEVFKVKAHIDQCVR